MGSFLYSPAPQRDFFLKHVILYPETPWFLPKELTVVYMMPCSKKLTGYGAANV
jgi:hypothetical protein